MEVKDTKPIRPSKLRKKLTFWLYLGYDKETLNKYEAQIAKDNLHVFSVALPIAAIITIAELLFVYLFAASGEGVTQSLYVTLNLLIFATVAIAVVGAIYLTLRNRLNMVLCSRIFTTALLCLWSILYIVIGTCINPEDYAVLACGMFLLIQVMFNAYPMENLVFIICAFVLFSTLCFVNKTTEVFIYDILDSFPFLLVGLFLSWIKSRSKWASLINADAMVQLKTQQLENELLQSQVAVMLSQIQPHFLYNSLAVIKDLCHTDPSLAEKVTVAFSNYLRGNLDSLQSQKPIRFVKELEHTKTFLALEKMQYGDSIDIIYDIRCDSFLIPTLTLQPIAENAVKYGMKHREHITVKISSFEDENSYYVVVEDDGIGFEPQAPLDREKSHVGISNVRKRLAVQARSTLDMNSSPESGTTVTITIPKEKSAT